MPKSVTLSTGAVVTFKPSYTHGADLAYSEVRYAEDYGDRVPVAVAMKACDAVLPVVIDTVAKDGQSVPATLEWLKDLPLPDYEVLYKLLLELREETQTQVEAG